MNQRPVRFLSVLQRGVIRRGFLFGGILLVALLAFEVFNFSTTEFALRDVLGSDLRFAGLRWATILAVAFCGIDFAGIARLFTPQQGRDEPAEVWYLFGAWLLAAAFNALLTWWGVAVAIRTHTVVSGAVLSQGTLQNAVPVFVALMVWLIRVLIIGSFSMAGERLFSMADDRRGSMIAQALTARRSDHPTLRPDSARIPRPAAAHQTRPAPRPSAGQSLRPGFEQTPSPAPRPFHPAPKPEPTYQPVGLSAGPHEGDHNVRR